MAVQQSGKTLGTDVVDGGTPPDTHHDVQPGTGEKGKSWHSEPPNLDDEDSVLHTALEDSFPASDPPAPTSPATGWIKDDHAIDKAGGKGN